MAKDPGKLPRVAWFLGLVGVAGWASPGCGPRVQPDRPFPEEAVVHRERAPVASRGGRQVLVGELCPQSAAGRPAVAPLLLHTNQWIDTTNEVTGAVERGATPRFAAFGVDGKVAGVFDTVGLADIALGQSVAAGTYVGGAPCTSDAGQGQRTDDPACVAATGGCGLAVAQLTRPDDPPETPTFPTGGACVSDGALVVDIDGDGAVEWFPLIQALDGIRGPAQEWPASRTARPACAPRFALYDVKLVPEADPGKTPDARATVTLDLLGVIDLDGDGRKELVIALRFPTVRTIVVYSAPSSPERLELVGEAQSFQK
ncbi:MAG TPA: hypothetical protein VGD37_09155 [Kofleriaceae bacterium]